MKTHKKQKQFTQEESLLITSDISKRAKQKSFWYTLGIGLFALIAITLCFLHQMELTDDILLVLSQNNHRFYWMLLVGFCAEIVAGSMGMGYGVICTTILLVLNVSPPAISASIHTAETFTSAAGSLSHFKLKNVNKKLVQKLAIPAVVGAIIGAIALTYLGERYAKAAKPFIAAYTIYLGIQILKNGLKKSQKTDTKHQKTNINLLGFSGGFIDSFAGGGWGPLVTGTLIKSGRIPRYVIGSSTVAKFILTITSAITFVITIGIKHWDIVLGLLIGGIITAPFSAMLTSKLPTKKIFFIVGCLVVFLGCVTICKSIF